MQIAASFRKLAGELNISASGLAIAWLLHQGDNIIPIPGTRTVKHLEELAEGTRRNLTQEELALIDTTLPIGWAHVIVTQSASQKQSNNTVNIY